MGDSTPVCPWCARGSKPDHDGWHNFRGWGEERVRCIQSGGKPEEGFHPDHPRPAGRGPIARGPLVARSNAMGEMALKPGDVIVTPLWSGTVVELHGTLAVRADDGRLIELRLVDGQPCPVESVVSDATPFEEGRLHGVQQAAAAVALYRRELLVRAAGDPGSESASGGRLDAAAGRKFRAAARVLRNAGITLAGT